MKKKKTYMSADELVRDLGDGKRFELASVLHEFRSESYSAFELKESISRAIGVKLTTSCANDLRHKYNKIYKGKQ
ncbi:hypothetical protein KYLE_87 [Pantoea phage Kyle]|uniref:Uncharacterized protein n=1 Tax=Pantoea phage Kyle TaxID=2589665 RepID=A0A514A8R5_9CAUD|nr:hypothetical protein HWC52_gp087 [Pantoea phage Kyle]QDH49662.1 hypothetical protein KYLE_87 [Pantoea phage Kyle]